MHRFSVGVYDIVIRVFGLGISIASFFNRKAKLWKVGRALPFPSLPDKKGRTIWFHCASLGEFEQARPVIEEWNSNHPEDIIILSFFSPSGYEVRKNYECADAVVYLPLDTRANAQHFLDWANPDIALFVKYEFWWHHLHELFQRGIRCILFAAVFRKEQIFFRRHGKLFRTMLGWYSGILVQNEASKELLKTISTDATVVSDTRFDRVNQIALERKTFPKVKAFKGDKKVLMAGSTWPKDEELLRGLMTTDRNRDLKFVFAPHDISPERIASLQRSLPLPSALLSDTDESKIITAEVLIVDSMGHLASLYAYAEVAYVGGGFDASIHNVLEAAVFGIPVLFGPNHHKSIEAKELMEIEGAFSVSSTASLIRHVNTLLSSGKVKSQFEKNREYVEKRTGGTQQVVKEIDNLLSSDLD